MGVIEVALAKQELASDEPGAAPSTAFSRPSFRELYQAELDFVWRSLRRLGVPEPLVDDATHEVFLVALRKLEQFEGRSSARTWLFGIALRVARKLAIPKSKVTDPLTDEVEDSHSAGPQEVVSRNQAIRTLYALLDELEEDRRAVFILIELEQMTAVEVASALGAPLNTVYSRLRLARRDFDAALRRHRTRDEWRVR